MESTSCSASSSHYCTADASPDFPLSTIEQLALGFVLLAITFIILLQMDVISRHILAPDQLLAKRRQEYVYAVSQCVEYNTLMIRQYVGGGKKLYSPKSEDMVEKMDGEMKELVDKILDSKKATPVIVAIEQDATESNPDTYYLYLAFPTGEGTSTPAAPGLFRRVRVPLVEFCEELAKAFEGQITSTAFCFVADASCGLGSEMLTSIVNACDTGVATISNPSWMFVLALIVSKNTHNITKEQFERIIFALCRLDAWRVRDFVGVNRTVLFALPGQASVPLLLPIIQKVFVHERHVFIYDGCCHTVSRGTALRQEHGASYRQTETLAKLNGVQASIVEAWVASVDTFLDMKAREKKNFYTPFVCRLGFLMKRSGIGNGDGSDLSGLALKNILQYVTGSKSRALSAEVMERAEKCLTECRAAAEAYVEKCKIVTNTPEAILIEKCVFTHKSILIGEKTLLDTVQPKEDWSLKAAKKLKSCLCCIPGEGDEEDEDEDGAGERDEGSKQKNKIDMSMPGAFATSGRRSNYVDGKAGFAFDPTRFK